MEHPRFMHYGFDIRHAALSLPVLGLIIDFSSSGK
jgi:hypothetical protein